MDFSIRKIVVAALVALVLTVAVRAASVPAYLNVDGATVTGCVKDELPESLVIPDGIKGIGRGAFKGCGGLKTVTIPESVRSIGEDAFADCGIKTVQYKGTLAQWCQIESEYGFVSAGTITMSDVVDLKAMTALTIPEGVESVRNNAFAGCDALVSVTIPASVRNIAEKAFTGCKSLKTVQYRGTLAQWCLMDNDWNRFDSSSVRSFAWPITITMADVVDLTTMTAIAVPRGVTRIGNNAFAGCNKIMNVTIPDSVRSIGKYSFKGCMGLTTLAIPKSVTVIGSGAFENCGGLTSVTIPSSLIGIEDKTFAGCGSLRTVQYNGTLAQWCQMDNDSVLLANAKTITMSDVADLTVMTELAVPKGVERIGKYAFYKCSGLVSVTIPDGVTSIEDSAFFNCVGIKSVTIPGSVQSIGGNAFFGCKNITAVRYNGTLAQWCRMNNAGLDIRAKTVTLSDVADINKMTALTIPAGVTDIGSHAFENCGTLLSVIIPDGVRSIGDHAFAGCNGIMTVIIPESVTNIGDKAFDSCKNLKTVKYKGTFAQWFQMENDGTLAANAKTITMSDVADLAALTDFAIPDGTKTVRNYAFAGCSRLKTITIPESVKSIGDYAFSGCIELTNITIPSGVESIGRGAFSGCRRLGSVTISNKVKSIPIEAFKDCSSLTSVIIPDSITSIGGSAFSGCSELTAVTIGVGVENIGAFAFYDCRKLLVQFSGTRGQWQGITMGNKAFGDSSYQTIHKNIQCTDGNTTVASSY